MRICKILLLYSLFLLSCPVWAQDAFLNGLLENTRKCLNQENKDCELAAKNYEKYLEYGGKPNKELEKQIKECSASNLQNGYLRIEGDNNHLAKAAIIIIDNKGNKLDGKSCIWTKQELPVGDYVVRIEHDKIIPIEKIVTILSGETKNLRVDVEPNYAIVTFVVDSKNAEIFFKNPKNDRWENKGKEKWNDAQLEFGCYDIKCQKRGFKDSFTHVVINKNSEGETYELKAPIPKGKFFITGNFAYSVIPQKSFGFSLGYVNRFGGYVSFMGCKLNSGAGITADCDAEGFLNDGSRPNYIEEKTKRSRLSVMVGGIVRFSGPLYGRIGIGYGERNLYWGTEDGLYYRNLGYSVVNNRIDLSLGLQLHIINLVVVSLDYVVTGFEFSQFSEIKLGLGVAL